VSRGTCTYLASPPAETSACTPVREIELFSSNRARMKPFGILYIDDQRKSHDILIELDEALDGEGKFSLKVWYQWHILAIESDAHPQRSLFIKHVEPLDARKVTVLLTLKPSCCSLT
jgi:hypothetical protein